MFDGLDENRLPGAIEALLFVSDEPVDIMTISEMLDVRHDRVDRILRALARGYEDRGSGLELREVAGGWRLFTAPAFHDLIERYVVSWDTRRLTQASLETLAIVAYNQPVTRASISSIRGVNSDSSVNSLLEKGLIREAGTADAPGNPMLYVTTRNFLERFGLASVDDLPDVTAFAPDEATKALIRERLGGGTAEEVAETEGGLPFGAVEKIDFDTLVFDTDDDD